EEEYVERLEPHRLDRKEVTGQDAGRLLTEEHRPADHAPARGRSEPVATQECPDRGGRTSKAELCQFPLNPLISPPRVLASQSQNQRLRRLVEGRSARPAADPRDHFRRTSSRCQRSRV